LYGFVQKKYWIIIDSKHTNLFNYVYDTNLKTYNDTATTPYKTDEWNATWKYGKKKTEDLEKDVIGKIRDTERNKTVSTVTLSDYKIYVGKHKVGDMDYAVAIYSRMGKISNVKKVVVQDLEELKNDSIKEHLYCESTYTKYLVLAFYEENESEPVLMIQAAKNKLEVFSSKHLTAWMEYLGIMVDSRDIIIDNVRWISQFSSEINGRNCHWCTSGLCCNGGSPCETCPKDSTNKTKCCPVACTDTLQTTTCDSCTNQVICQTGTCKSNNCCFQTALAMIEQFGLTTNRNQAVDIATLINNNSWKEQSDLQADITKFNESISYIDETLKSGNPVLIGVHYENDKDKLYNANKATLHYMIIVGKIHKNDKEYYWFYDPGTSNELKGKSAINLLEIDRNKNMIYGIYKKGKIYTITEVRKNL
jgi:hypothetical protein